MRPGSASLGRAAPGTALAWLVPALLMLASCAPSKLPAPAPAPQQAAPPPAAEPPPAPPPRPAPDEGAGGPPQVRVGLLLPLTGPEAALGRSLMNAAALALFDFADDRLALLPRDTGGTAGGAASAARAALGGGAALLLGPVFSSSLAAAAPVARAAGRNVVSFSNSRPAAGRGAFLMGLLPAQQIRRVVGYARSRGYARIAAILPDTPFGRQVAPGLAALVAEAGGALVRAETVGDDAGAADAAVRALKEPGYDALLLALSGDRLREVAAFLPYHDVDTGRIKVLGLSSWAADRLGGEPALRGAWFAAPSAAAARGFADRYREVFGAAPDPLAGLAYDAAALAAVLARSGSDFGEATLTDPRGFAGAAGIFRFRRDGVSEHGLSVFEVQASAAREIDPAPETFAPRIN